MNNEDVLQRNDAGELEIRTAPSTGDTGTNPDDVYTRDEQGRLCVRTTGGGGGGGTTPTAAGVSFDPAGLTTITGDNVQSALEQVDTSLNTLDGDMTYLGTQVTEIKQSINTLNTNVSGKANRSDLPQNQTGTAGQVYTKTADGADWSTLDVYSQEETDQQIQNAIGTIETALAEV